MFAKEFGELKKGDHVTFSPLAKGQPQMGFIDAKVVSVGIDFLMIDVGTGTVKLTDVELPDEILDRLPLGPVTGVLSASRSEKISDTATVSIINTRSPEGASWAIKANRSGAAPRESRFISRARMESVFKEFSTTVAVLNVGPRIAQVKALKYGYSLRQSDAGAVELLDATNIAFDENEIAGFAQILPKLNDISNELNSKYGNAIAAKKKIRRELAAQKRR